jgi:hypothetical protein
MFCVTAGNTGEIVCLVSCDYLIYQFCHKQLVGFSFLVIAVSNTGALLCIFVKKMRRKEIRIGLSATLLERPGLLKQQWLVTRGLNFQCDLEIK